MAWLSNTKSDIFQVDSSIGAIRDSLQDLPSARRNMDPGISKPEVERAVKKIAGSIWLSLSGLQLLVRELVMLLAPYLTLFYQNSIQYLMLYGDHFLFEGSIGRIERLACAQFQHWHTFYDFLVRSFRGEPGFNFVLAERFVVMNGYNDYPITKEAWQAVIQPESKVVMAMTLEGTVARQRRCADHSCPGRVSFQSANTTRIWRVGSLQTLSSLLMRAQSRV
jgi:hypothetical protein